MHVVEQPLL